MRVDDLRSLSIFDSLTDDQLADLIKDGTEVRVETGVELFHEGDHADFWWVLVDGAIDLIRRVGREDTVVARMNVPGRWAGGFRAWDEHGTYLATGRGSRDGRVLKVPAAALRDRANTWFPFGAHLIAGLYRTARSVESTARQRMSLVTLGTLAAGIAHDQQPSGCGQPRSPGPDTQCQTLLSSVRLLAEQHTTPEQFAALGSTRAVRSSREPRPWIPLIERIRSKRSHPG
jgi:CRP-like cAMP-binding protein